MYIKVTYDCGGVIDVELHYPGNYGAPGMERSKRQKRTPEDIVRQNHTNRVKKVKRLILCNFRPGDFHLTLNYRKDDRPETIDQAKTNLSEFLKRMRLDLKKTGHTFKFIGVTEIGKRGQALHHHLIIEDLSDIRIKDLVLKYWTYGGTNWSTLYEDGGYEQLASYIVKKDTKIGSWHTYTRSRGNLKKPKVDRKPMKRKCWPENPWIKEGYLMMKDTLYDGINPVTGYPYRHYSMMKIGGDNVKRNNIHRDHDTRSG